MRRNRHSVKEQRRERVMLEYLVKQKTTLQVIRRTIFSVVRPAVSVARITDGVVATTPSRIA